MISIVLYGRNDNYGYNLHKRAALSLNCMAEVLTDPSDEILFVDYNTPDDFPTFPEAIQDTLTKRARKLLRIFRVRPRVHERFKTRTRLLALEPIARNVAIRRSNPANRWILSTNTDMIFVPQHAGSLSKIARDLPNGFYHAPRIEIPEALWESLDRREPKTIIRTVREWGTALHLNEIVLGSKFIRYDGPGDFQLLLRTDLFENHGFDEDMLLGWHVDSNIAARMQLKYRNVGDLGQQVYGYHCDHTRQVTPAHSHTRVQNDWRKFVDDVARPDVPQQASNWGCAGDAIEEVRIAADPAGAYVKALRDVIGKPLAAPNVVSYTGETYNKADYDPPHLVPFLADMFVSMPRNLNVGWYGARDETLRLFAGVWQRLGFTGKIFLERGSRLSERTETAIHNISQQDLLTEADVFIFDFGCLKPVSVLSPEIDQRTYEMLKSFRRVVYDERHQLSTGAPARRIVALNAINNSFEWFVGGYVAAAATPFSTHMRHGFVFPASAALGDWLPLLSVGEAGVRVEGHLIKCAPARQGLIAYGPFKYLEKGRYLISLEIERSAEAPAPEPGNRPWAFVEVAAGPELLGLYLLRNLRSHSARHRFTFDVSENVAEGVGSIESRVGVTNPGGVTLRALTIEAASVSISTKEDVPTGITVFDMLQLDDWLPFLRVGPLGRADQSAVNAGNGPGGFVVFGPYWSLPPGTYEMTAYIEQEWGVITSRYLIVSDVLAGDRQVAAARFQLTGLAYDELIAASVLRLPFQIDGSSLAARTAQMRIWSSGEAEFKIRSLSVRAVNPQHLEEIFPILLTGDAGQRTDGAIRNIDGRIGRVAYNPAFTIEPGAYGLTFELTLHADSDSILENRPTCVIVVVKCGSHVVEIDALAGESGQRRSRQITFEISPDAAATGGIEFTLQVVAAANVALHTLMLKRVKTALRRERPAACELDNWLPYLQTGPSAHADADGVVVREGRPEFPVYGPYWTLPVGRYELIASIVPLTLTPGSEPAITLDVSTDTGERLVAKGEWRLDQLVPAGTPDAAVLRLPFALGAELPAASRMIETRIFTSGKASFRVRSMAVRILSDEPPAAFSTEDRQLSLQVGAAGFQTERGVCALPDQAGNVGYIRYPLAPGRYETVLRVERVGSGHPGGQTNITAGSTLLASGRIEFAALRLGPIRIPRGPFRIYPFEVPPGLPPDVRNIHIRIDSNGGAGFLLRSVAVKPKTPIRDLRDSAYAAAVAVAKSMLRTLALVRRGRPG